MAGKKNLYCNTLYCIAEKEAWGLSLYCNTILYCDLKEGVRLYCSMRKCIAIGGLKEELYCKIGIVLQDNQCIVI